MALLMPTSAKTRFHVVANALLLLLLEISCSRAQQNAGDGSGTVMNGSPQEGINRRQVPQHMVIPAAPFSAAVNESKSQQSSLDMKEPAKPVERLHSVSQTQLSALLGAAVSGDLLTVRVIIMDEGVSPEVHNVLGWTPLNLAALAGRLEVVKFLILEAAANRETREIYGQTPLGSASINGHIEVVKFLLNLDPIANPSAQDLDGATPLHYAAQFGYADVCRALLDKGADPNAIVPQNGWTPLHSASAAGQVDSIQVLLGFGADKERKDNDGNKPGQIIGLTLQVTKRKRRQLQCLLDPDAVFGGCEGHNQQEGGQDQKQQKTHSQNDWNGSSNQNQPPPFNPGNVAPAEHFGEVTNDSSSQTNEG